MLILSYISLASVTNLTQRHFFLGILCQFGYSACLVHRKATPLALSQINHNRKGGVYKIEQPEVGPKGESSGGELVKEQR
jgi:hypothetical protein